MYAANNPSKVKALILYAPAFIICYEWAPDSASDVPPEPVYATNGMFIGPKYYLDLWNMFEGDNIKLYSMMSAYPGPVLIIHGTSDEVTSIIYTRKMYDYYENVTFNEYIDADHQFEGNENHQKLLNDTLDFLDEH